MVEQLESQFIPALQATNKMALFATQFAILAIMESDQSAGNLVHLVGLMKEHSAESLSMFMEKDVAAQSSVAVVVLLAILMTVALAEDLPKLWLRAPMVVELESHWAAQAMKILMADSATRNVKMATLESVQSVGKTVLETPLTLELHALRNHMAEPLESQ